MRHQQGDESQWSNYSDGDCCQAGTCRNEHKSIPFDMDPKSCSRVVAQLQNPKPPNENEGGGKENAHGDGQGLVVIP